MIQKSFGKMNIRFFIVWVIIFQIFALSAESASISINARFEPTEVDVNSEVRYIVDITNAVPDKLKIPQVAGLRKRSENVYQSSSLINGVASQKTSFIFTFISEKTGTIEIPEYTIEIDGEPYPIMPAKVKIINDPYAAASQQRDQGIALDISILKERVYVGQNIPVTLSITLDESIQLVQPIKAQIVNDAFFQAPLSKQPKLRTGRGYEIYSWDTFITPLKAGKHEISFTVTCPIQVVRSMGFFSFAEQELINVPSRPIPLEVHSLAEAPADFRGGIGQFTLKNSRLSSDRALLGEPITLSVDIEGQGNFSRLQPPEIASNELWKVFSPKSTFVGQDDYDFKGVKTVEYVIVPQKTGEIPVPDITLTYFDPETERFETTRIDNSQKIILVSRSAETFFDHDTGSGVDNKTKDHKEKNSVSVIHIFSNDTRPFQTLAPFYCHSWFWILQGFLMGLALLLLFKTRIQTTTKKAPKWDMKKISKVLTKNARMENIEQFYKIAKESISQKLIIYNIHTAQRSEQIKQLQERGLKHLKWLELFLNEADAISFGQGKIDQKHLDLQLEKLLMFLQQ
ncbi:MAG: BatD family protein [Puniceicoccales bacterium]|jgi:hypothetical protein|nr:BatD family protein [Puniceicoccales bacterium]